MCIPHERREEFLADLKEYAIYQTREDQKCQSEEEGKANYSQISQRKLNCQRNHENVSL